MDITKISPGKDLPNQINVIIEVPMNADPVKYEMDKDSGAIFVDRFIATPMYYPCNYGFIPGTLSDDGDPADVLVISDFPVVPGAVIAAKPVGVLIMEDEKGMDEKILAVPAKKLNSQFENVESYKELPENLVWLLWSLKKSSSSRCKSGSIFKHIICYKMDPDFHRNDDIILFLSAIKSFFNQFFSLSRAFKTFNFHPFAFF